jgi:hypothetical protein
VFKIVSQLPILAQTTEPLNRARTSARTYEETYVFFKPGWRRVTAPLTRKAQVNIAKQHRGVSEIRILFGSRIVKRNSRYHSLAR